MSTGPYVAGATLNTSPYVPLEPHVVPEVAKEFLASMTEKEKALHELAIELLGSSYFIEFSRGFEAFKH